MSALDRLMPRTRRQPTTALDVGACFDLLSNERRRRVIQYVAGCSPGAQVDIGELADVLTRAEVGEDYDSADRKRVYIALVQAHRDPLVRAGVLIPVRDGVFTIGPDADALAGVIAQVSEVCEG